jgi:hypothetical protein
VGVFSKGSTWRRTLLILEKAVRRELASRLMPSILALPPYFTQEVKYTSHNVISNWRIVCRDFSNFLAFSASRYSC